MLGSFRGPRRSPRPAAGVFVRGPFPYGYSVPRLPRGGVDGKPALEGLFRSTGHGAIGVSQINAIATNIRRGPLK